MRPSDGRGMEQLAARRAHNPKVAGSSPAPATKAQRRFQGFGKFVGNRFKRSLVQKYFFESLDELEETVHNLASLLLTNLTRRRSESSLKIWTTDRCGCLDAKRRKLQKVLRQSHGCRDTSK